MNCKESCDGSFQKIIVNVGEQKLTIYQENTQPKQSQFPACRKSKILKKDFENILKNQFFGYRIRFVF